MDVISKGSADSKFSPTDHSGNKLISCHFPRLLRSHRNYRATSASPLKIIIDSYYVAFPTDLQAAGRNPCLRSLKSGQ